MWGFLYVTLHCWLCMCMSTCRMASHCAFDRSCLSDERLHVRLQELKSFLLERGYSGPDVDQQFTKAVRVPRLVALQAKKVSGDRVPLVCEWNERLPNLGGLIQQFLPVLQSDENLSTCFSAPPLLSYRRPRNLRDLLVHTVCKNPDHPSSFCGRLVQVRACSVHDLRDDSQPNSDWAEVGIATNPWPFHLRDTCPRLLDYLFELQRRRCWWNWTKT